MIKISELKSDDIGCWVIFKAEAIFLYEIGRIKSWNDKWVFVVFKCDGQWDKFQDYTGCATNPEQIDFMGEDDEEDNIYNPGGPE